MTIEFKLPELAEGIESADVADILVAAGDTIQADQVVMALETDKAVMDLRCPHAGKIGKILVKAGDTQSLPVEQPVTLTVGNPKGVNASLRGAAVELPLLPGKTIARVPLK